jgi:hypothetical protein
MSFDRRWLLTAAGSAFLASITRRADGAAPVAETPPPSDPEKGPKLAWAEFQSGFGAMTETEKTTCSDFLVATYGDRFDRIYKDLGDDSRRHLIGFAKHLGELTAFCLSSARHGKCGWTKPLPGVAVQLTGEHLQRARELVGFATNKRLKGIRCSGLKRNAKGEYDILQADEPCPLCPP